MLISSLCIFFKIVMYVLLYNLYVEHKIYVHTHACTYTHIHIEPKMKMKGNLALTRNKLHRRK